MTRRDGQLPVHVSQDPGWRFTRRGRLAMALTAAAGILAAAAVPNASRITSFIDPKPQPGCELLAPEFLLDNGQPVEELTGLGDQPVPVGLFGLALQVAGHGGAGDALDTEQELSDLNPNLGIIYPGQTELTMAAGGMCQYLSGQGYVVSPLPGHRETS